MVDVGKRIFLKLFIFRLPEPGSQSLACQSRKPGASHAQDQSDHATDHHFPAFLENIGSVPGSYPHINQIRHDQRDQKLKDRLCRNTEQSKEPIFFILSHVRKQPSNHLPHLHCCICNYCMPQVFSCQSLLLYLVRSICIL